MMSFMGPVDGQIMSTSFSKGLNEVLLHTGQPVPSPLQRASPINVIRKRPRQEWLHIRAGKHEEFCQCLGLDERTQKMSWDILHRTFLKNAEVASDDTTYKDGAWNASAVWLAGKIIQFNESHGKLIISNGLPLTRILHEIGCEPDSFLVDLNEFMMRCNLDNLAVEQRTFVENEREILGNTFSIVCIVCRRYRDMFDALFRFHSNQEKAIHSKQKQGVRHEKATQERDSRRNLVLLFGWMVFLIAKERLLGREHVTVAHAIILLVCVLHFMHEQLSVPVCSEPDFVIQSLGIPYHSISQESTVLLSPRKDPKSSLMNATSELVFRALCHRYSISYAEFCAIEEKRFYPFIQHIVNSFLHYKDTEQQHVKPSGVSPWGSPQKTRHSIRQLHISVPSILDGIGVSRYRSLDELLGLHKDGGFLETNVEEMSRHYDSLIRISSGEMDYRALFPLLRMSGGIVPLKHTGLHGADPYKSMVLHTTKASVDRMGSSHSGSATHFEGIDRSLEMSLDNDRVVEEDRRSRDAQTANEKFLSMLNDQPHEPNELLDEYCNRCTINPRDSIIKRIHSVISTLSHHNVCNKKFVVALYFRVLTRMLIYEEGRLGQGDFSPLLHDDRFHRSMLAISAIVVQTAHCIDLSLSVLLNACQVKAFDLMITIESFIRHEPEIHWPAVNRLRDIEELILECEAWKDWNPIYVLLQEDIQKHGRANCAARKALTHVALSPVQFFGEVTPSSKRIPSSFVNSNSISGSCSQLSLFFRKLYRICHLRLTCLARALHLSESITRRAWMALVEALETEHEKRLLHLRHIDQLMMCCVYGVCKTLDEEHKFKEIVLAYRQQPQAMTEVFQAINVLDRIVGSQEVGFPQRISTGTVMSAEKIRTTKDEVYPGHRTSVDIIQFYNIYFLPVMKSFLKALRSTSADDKELDIPVPAERDVLSPRKLSAFHRIYLSPVKSRDSLVSQLSPHGGLAVSPVRSTVFQALPSSPSADRTENMSLTLPSVTDNLHIPSSIFSSPTRVYK